MKNLLLFVLASLVFSLIGFSQNIDSETRKIKMLLSGGMGVSYFHYNVKNFNQKIHGKYYRFAAPTCRIGVIAARPISERLTLNAGLRVGLRIKRETLYEESRRSGLVYPYTFFDVDSRVSSVNHYSIEIPLELQYAKGKARFGLGGAYRYFISGEPVGFSYGSDLGLTASLSYDMSPKINLGLEYYLGAKVFAQGSVHNDFGDFIYYDARNRLMQFTAAYKIVRVK